jgi:hypothetical protein
MRRISTSGPTAVAAFVLAFHFASPSPASAQGMGTAKRARRPVKAVETDLPPIAVDFRDVAVEAGLVGVNLSGGANRKKYILEATGNGVAIFDFDNDGLMGARRRGRRARSGCTARPAF